MAHPLTVGVDLGGTKIQVVVVSGEAVTAQARHPTPRTDAAAVMEEIAASVREAVGANSPAVITAFEGAFLGSLVHDVNVVHGLLERMGEPLTGQVIAGDWWNEGQAVTGAVRLSSGARWDSAWIQLLDVYEYRESVSFFFAEEVHTLAFPSPWLKQSPTRYEVSRARDGARVAESFESYEESFARELAHLEAVDADMQAMRDQMDAEGRTGGFRPVLDDSRADKDAVRRLVLCSGKIYYDVVGHETREQAEAVRGLRASRDAERVAQTLAELQRACADPARNLMPPLIDAVAALATEGEIVEAMAAVYGRYVESPTL